MQKPDVKYTVSRILVDWIVPTGLLEEEIVAE